MVGFVTSEDVVCWKLLLVVSYDDWGGTRYQRAYGFHGTVSTQQVSRSCKGC
jgi:hypothetical protein